MPFDTRFASIHRVLSVVPTASGVPPKRGPPCKQGATNVCIRHCGSAPRIPMWLTMSFSFGSKQRENDTGPLHRRPGDFSKSQPTLFWKPSLRLASVSFSFCFRRRASADPPPRSHGSLTIHRVVLIHGSHRFIVYSMWSPPQAACHRTWSPLQAGCHQCIYINGLCIKGLTSCRVMFTIIPLNGIIFFFIHNIPSQR